MTRYGRLIEMGDFRIRCSVREHLWRCDCGELLWRRPEHVKTMKNQMCRSCRKDHGLPNAKGGQGGWNAGRTTRRKKSGWVLPPENYPLTRPIV